MLLLRSLVLALLPLAFAAKKDPAERFNEYHTKSASASPLVLSDTTYSRLTANPRDYSVTVLLTALEARYGCALCREFQPEWDLLAKSSQRGQLDSRLIFGTLDFEKGKETFQSLGLTTAPVLLLFPPTAGPHAVSNPAPQRLDFAGPQTAEQVHSWISRLLPDRKVPDVKRPINWGAVAVRVSTTFIGFVTLYVAFPYLLPLLQNRNIWAAISLVAILLFTSGHMFNHIRKVPYVSGDGRGGVSYFAGGFQNQFGLETQIIAAIYGFLSFATISLALKVPRISDPRTQQLAVVIWVGVMLGVYSFLLSVFRMKNGGYPFYLPPFF